ncbi:GAF domain-containing protein [Actinoallomurus liliacearum]|uniref:GAF domain-containing protein n=1 Tax=Actinoallomurus liliacearum TaxID=1080073 RepID=A0ABP8TFK6_9ACTN
MSFSPAFRLVTPIDKNAQIRAARLQELGIREEPDPEFDDFAAAVARDLDVALAVVNIIGAERQYFAGLYPSSHERGVDPRADPFRIMACDHGYCIYVIARNHALALDEVMDYHIFAGNPVVEAIGARSYLGAPLIDGTLALGTVAVVDTRPRNWGAEGVAYIKARAAELMEKIEQRPSVRNGHAGRPHAMPHGT